MLGDTHAPELCLLAGLHGQSLEGVTSSQDFLESPFAGSIDLCLLDLGLAAPIYAHPDGAIPIGDFGRLGTLRRDADALELWLQRQLEPFGGELGKAAEFALRLAAIRVGILHGPETATLEQVLDDSQWHESPGAQRARKPWWRFWS